MDVFRVFVADDPSRAHLVKGVLEAEGIPAEVRGDQPFWADGTMVPTDMHPAVWVRDEDSERALAILTEIEERVRTRGAWTCTCGTELDGPFDTCWNCGKVRPD